MTLGSGVGIIAAGNNSGTVNISFPYAVRGSGDSVFHSKAARPYPSQKVIILPFAFEIGNLHHFVTTSFSSPVIRQFTDGFNLSLGYGYNFYLDGFKHSNTIEEKAFVIKPSISLSYTNDRGGNRTAGLGKINNQGNTIVVFGKTSGPTFDYTTTTDYIDGISSTSTDTYDSRTIDVDYVQRELAIVPTISITNNQYKNHLLWAFTAGYNIPLHEWGGVRLTQDDGDDHFNTLAGFTQLNHSGIITTYNGRATSGTPFNFSGLYLNFALSITIPTR